MILDKKDSVVCADPIDNNGGAAEMDLYEELVAFAALTPEEQSKAGDSVAPTAEPIDHVVGDEVKESEPFLTQPPDEQTVVVESQSNAVIATEETPSDIQTISTETYDSQGTNASPAPPAVNNNEHASPEFVVADDLVESVEPAAEVEQETAAPETIVTHSSIESVEETSVTAEEATDSKFEQKSIEMSIERLERMGPRPSGPLSGFNLPPEIVYTGAMSPGVCLACGSESSADDLFCLACGVFIDEIASTLPTVPKCAECDQPSDPGDIFCPWCGSPLSA